MDHRFSALGATTHMWVAFTDVLTQHHYDITATVPCCACGVPFTSRRSFAQHQVAQLVFEGVLPSSYTLEWGVVRPGVDEPFPLPFAEVLREIDQASTSRSTCRSIYPPGPWLEDLRSLP